MIRKLLLVIVLCGLSVLTGCTKKAEVKNSQKAESIEELEKQLAKAPSYENHIRLGLALSNKSQSDRALVVYQKAIKVNPNAPVAWNNICAEYNKRKEFFKATQNCEKAISIEPEFQLAKNNLKLAQASMAKKKVDLQTKKATLISDTKTSGQDLINLGMDFFNIGDFTESAEVWGRVSKDSKHYANSRNNMASAFILMKQFNKAELSIKEALKLDPSNQLYNNNLKWLNEEKSQVKKR